MTTLASNAQVTSSLSKLCSSSSSCSDSLIKQSLTWFSGNCSAELAAGNQLVTSNYDVFYVLSPFITAVCTMDESSGSYCALEIGHEPAASSTTANATAPLSSTNTSTPATPQSLFVQAPHINMADLYITLSDAAKSAANRLTRRNAFSVNSHSLSVRSANSTNGISPNTTTNGISTMSSSSGNSPSSGSESSNALLPNATTFRSSNLPFLFLSGNMSSAQLCTSCTKSILAAYVEFETQFPYSECRRLFSFLMD